MNQAITGEQIANSVLPSADKVQALLKYFGGDLNKVLVSPEKQISLDELGGLMQQVHHMEGSLGQHTREQIIAKKDALKQAGLTRQAILFLFDGGYCGRVDFLTLLKTVDHSKLRPSQSQAVYALIEYIENHPDDRTLIEGIIKLPTGVGKTFRSASVVKALQKNTLFLAPTRDLVRQTANAYVMSGFTHDQIITIPATVFDPRTRQYQFAGAKTAKQMMEDALRMIFKNPNKQHVIISSYDSKLSVGRTEQPSIDQLSQYIQVIINDEAHRLTGVQTKDAMDMFVESIQQHSQPLNLLMTATTDRTNTSLRDDYETIFSMTIQQAIDEGSIVKPRYHTLGVAEYTHSGNRPADNEVEIGSVRSLINGKPVHEVAIDAYKNELDQFGYFPTILFVANNDQARTVLAYCQHKGIRAKICTNESIKQDPRNSVVHIQDDIRNDRIDIVITVKKLAEGFDEKLIRGIIRGYASRDPSGTIQGNGRALRTCTVADIPASLVAAVRHKPPFAGRIDDAIRNMLSKGTHNTVIFEPDMWIMKPRLDMDIQITNTGSGHIVVKSNKERGIEFFLNSEQLMIQNGEMDHIGQTLIIDEREDEPKIEPGIPIQIEGEMRVGISERTKRTDDKGVTRRGGIILKILANKGLDEKEGRIRGNVSKMFRVKDLEKILSEICMVIEPGKTISIEGKEWIGLNLETKRNNIPGSTIMRVIKQSGIQYKEARTKFGNPIFLYLVEDLTKILQSQIIMSSVPIVEGGEEVEIDGEMYVAISKQSSWLNVLGANILNRIEKYALEWRKGKNRITGGEMKLYPVKKLKEILLSVPVIEGGEKIQIDGEIRVAINQLCTWEGMKGGAILTNAQKNNLEFKKGRVRVGREIFLYREQDLKKVLEHLINLVGAPEVKSGEVIEIDGKQWVCIVGTSRRRGILGTNILKLAEQGGLQKKIGRANNNPVSLYLIEDLEKLFAQKNSNE